MGKINSEANLNSSTLGYFTAAERKTMDISIEPLLSNNAKEHGKLKLIISLI